MGGGAAGMANAGGGKKSIYMEDVFSTHLYDGTGSTQSIDNGIDLSGEGGMVWIKTRGNGNGYRLVDTVRGATKAIESYDTTIEATESNGLTAFNDNGFTVGSQGHYNQSGAEQVSWTFRKAPGFFDIVTYTGNGTSNHQISHNLESVPGCIMLKCTTDTQDWAVYNRGTTDAAGPGGAYLRLNDNGAQVGTSGGFYNTTATNTHFTLGDSSIGNKNGETYVAYIFAGGESTASEATSTLFDGVDDSLAVPTSNQFDFGNGDFTIECWVKTPTNTDASIINISNGGASSNSSWIFYRQNGELYFYWTTGTGWSGPVTGGANARRIDDNQWHHLAVTRTGGYFRSFVDGIHEGTYNIGTTSIATSTRNLEIGTQNGSYFFDGSISNVRILKGTALYTESFRPLTKPLTNVTNTKLLCCQGSTVTSTTVIPSGTMTKYGDPYVKTAYSPFDDPEGFKFGEEGDQNIVKCGNYKGASSHSTEVEVTLGFEPQWIIIKNTSASKDWVLFDNMRKWTGQTSSNTKWLEPNDPTQEQEGSMARITSTGFICKDSSFVNGSSHNFAYIALRRPDGYVGKPVQDATKVFSIPSGKGGSSAPNYEGGHIVDFHLTRNATSSEHWYTGARLMGPYYVRTDDIGQWAGSSTWVYDFMTGYNTGSSAASWKSWQWKRHKGMDVVPYTGNSVQGRDVPHNLGVAPDMMWVKNLTRSAGGGSDWIVYVSGITHLSVYGSDPDNYGNNPPALQLNNQEAAGFSGSGYWDHAHPTSTHFRVGDTFSTNQSGESMLAMLFASIPGVSKVGTYEGSTGNVTVDDVGFSPRFLITKNCTTANNTALSNWNQVDTVRGFSTGNDARLRLNDASAPNNYNYAYPTSSGFVVTEADWKQNGARYIYYAHA